MFIDTSHLRNKAMKRKKNTAITLILLLISLTSYSQGYDFSIRIGTSIANLNGDPDSELSKYRAGLNIGFGIESEVNETSSFEFGIQYQQKGQNFKGELIDGSDVGTFDDNTTLNYLTLPVTFKKYLTSKKVAFSAGLYGSLLLSATSDLNQNFTGPGRSFTLIAEDVDVKNVFRGNDAGFMIGASFHPVSKIFVDFKSTWGLLNIATDNSNLDDIKNHSLELVIGVKI